MRNFGLGVLAALVFSAGAAYTQQRPSDDQVLREARDRAEIEDLMWRYTRALDSTDAGAYAAVYTPDGQFSAGSANATKGHDALRKMVADLRATRVANDAKGKVLWQTNVIKSAGPPGVGKPAVRHLSIKAGRVTAVYGKHSFAEFELATGKLLATGSD